MPSKPARRAVIDLGSGTVNLAVFEPGRDGLRNVHRRSTTLRLLAGVTEGALRPDALEGALAVLRSFVDEARAHGAAEPLLLATSAVRDASNRAELAERLLAERGVPLRVVDGGDEARMAARAVLHTLPLQDGCIVDLGGGSLQLAEVRGRRVRRVASLPVGSLRLLLTHPTGRVPAPEALSAMRRDVDAALDAVPWLRAVDGDVVGCGGTFRTLARVDRGARGAAQVHPHGQLLTRDALESLLEAASRMSEVERGAIPGVPAHRADLLVPGALVVTRLLLHLRVSSFRTSAVGIREGALLGAAPADAAQVRARGLRLRFGRRAAGVADARAAAALALLDALPVSDVRDAGAPARWAAEGSAARALAARSSPDAAHAADRARGSRSAAAPARTLRGADDAGIADTWRAWVAAAAWIDAACAVDPPEGGALAALLESPLHGFWEEDVHALADLLSDLPRGVLEPALRERLRLVLDLARAEPCGAPEVRSDRVHVRVRGHVHGSVAQRFHRAYGRSLVVDGSQRGKVSAVTLAS